MPKLRNLPKTYQNPISCHRLVITDSPRDGLSISYRASDNSIHRLDAATTVNLRRAVRSFRRNVEGMMWGNR